MRILKFELKKFFSSSKNILIIFITLFLVLLICLQKTQQLKLDKEELIINDTYLQDQLISEIDNNKETFPKEVGYINKAVTAIQKKWNYANNNDWYHSLKQEIVFIDSIQKAKKKIPLNYIDNNVLKSKEEKIFFLEHHIKPDDSLYGVSALYYVRLIIVILFSIGGLLIFIFLFYDLFSKEVEKNTIKLLLTQPISYSRIQISKLISGLLILESTILFLAFFSFIIGLILTKQLGHLSYPIAFTKNNNEILTNLSFNDFFMSGIGLFSLIVYSSILLSSFLSTFQITSEKILLIESCLYIILSQFSKIIMFKKYYLWPFSYINLSDTLIKNFTVHIFNYTYINMITFFFILILLTKCIIFKNHLHKKFL